MIYKTNMILLDEFRLKSGLIFKSIPACYTMYGDVENGKKLALFFHGFSSSSEIHVWWNKFNLKDILKKYNLLCINSLGSSHGSFGPNTINSTTGKPFFETFPSITIQDLVDFTVLVCEKIKIKKVDCLFGCSLGGMQVLDMFFRYPMFSDHFISIAGSPVSWMAKINLLTQARMITAFYDNKNILKSMMGFTRIFFRLQCSNEKALNILQNKQLNIDDYFLEDSAAFENKFSPYSCALYLNCVAHFEVLMTLYVKQKNPKLRLISIQHDSLTPKILIKKIFYELKKQKRNVSYSEFKTDFGHESWIVDGEKFYEFIKTDFNL
ncbi:MAG: hypothetical protein ACD_29C00044G0001 [uncultured bacterium]|nr:MAG: hypothetical protein ACD_29C00044G0001 [uncultured bacterium]